MDKIFIKTRQRKRNLSKNECIQLIQDKSININRVLIGKDFSSYEYSQILSYFRSLKDALFECGLETKKMPNIKNNKFETQKSIKQMIKSDYTKNELIEQIHNKAIELGRTPSSKHMRNPTEYVYYRIFGSWKNALKEAKLTSFYNVSIYDKDKLINILKETYEKLGRTPRSNEVKNPSWAIYKKIFGTWKKALEEAGLKYEKEANERINAKRIEDIIKLKSEGRTFEDIGKILGITRQRVHQIYKNNKTNNLFIKGEIYESKMR